MNSTIVIAKILSVGYLSVAFGMLFNLSYYQKMLQKICKNSSVLFLSGFVALIFGFVIIEQHQLEWFKDWSTLILVMGWMGIFKGLALLTFPKVSSNLYKGLIATSNFIPLIVIPILFLLGLLLGYYGFIV